MTDEEQLAEQERERSLALAYDLEQLSNASALVRRLAEMFQDPRVAVILADDAATLLAAATIMESVHACATRGETKMTDTQTSRKKAVARRRSTIKWLRTVNSPATDPRFVSPNYLEREIESHEAQIALDEEYIARLEGVTA